MMPLKEGQQVLIKNPRALVGTVVAARPEQPGVAEEDRLYKVHIDDTCICRNADLQAVNESTQMDLNSLEGNAELRRMSEALEKWLANNNDRAAWDQFAESGRKLGIILPMRKDGK
jgi:hypothetical protein